MKNLIWVLVFFLSFPAFADVWVNPFTSASTGHAGTQLDPYQSYSEPCAALNGIGGTAHFNAGTYSGRLDSGAGSCSGASASAPVIFQCDGALTTGGNGNCNFTNATSDLVQLSYNWNYFTIQGFNFTGVAANHHCITQTTDPSHIIHNHHISILHNSFSSCSCDSIENQNSDYITVKWNVVTNSGATCSTASVSGLHPYELVNYDYAAGVHNEYAYNIITGESKGTGPQSDGNGINIDDFRRLQHNDGLLPYDALTWVHDNIFAQNDGDCLNVFQSDKVIFTNNTCWHNTQNQANTASFAELVVSTSGNVEMANNILVPIGTSYYGLLYKTAINSSADANLFYGAQAGTYSATSSSGVNFAANNLTSSDPKLSNAPTNFTPQSGSGAIGAAFPLWASSTDYNGATRNRVGMRVNTAGAYSTNTLDMGAIKVTP